ncbi:MAG TPA: hypothetical protein VH372_17075 [Actinospica sp.]|jgi:hypothetical protein|nr:hypothetical protein [Actinospica sp.]
MIDVELEPEEITLILRALNALHADDDLDEAERETMPGLSLKLGMAMGEHLKAAS